MDEEQKALIESVVHEAAAPFTGVVADLVGLAGGDALHRFREERNNRRAKNARDTLDAAGRALVARGVTPTVKPGRKLLSRFLKQYRIKVIPA